MKKVLVVEDDLRFRTLLKRILEKRYGMQVLVAENGLRGLEVYQEDKPPMIFMDLDMPIMRGCDAIKKIKELNPEVPIVVITNSSAYDCVRETLELGIADYILKTELVLGNTERIENLIEKYKYVFT